MAGYQRRIIIPMDGEDYAVLWLVANKSGFSTPQKYFRSIIASIIDKHPEIMNQVKKMKLNPVTGEPTGGIGGVHINQEPSSDPINVAPRDEDADFDALLDGMAKKD